MAFSDLLSKLPSINDIQKVGEGLSQHFARVEEHMTFLEHEVMARLNDISAQIETLQKEILQANLRDNHIYQVDRQPIMNHTTEDLKNGTL